MPHARLRCLSASTTTQPLIHTSLLLEYELVYFILRDSAPRLILLFKIVGCVPLDGQPRPRNLVVLEKGADFGFQLVPGRPSLVARKECLQRLGGKGDFADTYFHNRPHTGELQCFVREMRGQRHERGLDQIQGRVAQVEPGADHGWRQQGLNHMVIYRQETVE